MMRSLSWFFALALASEFVSAEGLSPLALKGLQPGMSREAVRTAMPRVEGFTFGGVTPLIPSLPLVLRYQDDVVTSITFVFRPFDFDRVKSALLERYPAMRCSESVVSTELGGVAKQTACRLAADGLLLTAQRYAGRLDMASVDLRAVESAENLQQQRRKDAGDM